MIDLDFPAIGRRVAKYRKLNEVSAQALADTAGAGLTRAIIANIESGRRTDMSVSHLLAIAWALGVPPVALLFPIHEPESNIRIDGEPHKLSEVMDWFHGWPHKPNPFDLATSNAGIGVAAILRGLDMLSRAEERLKQYRAELSYPHLRSEGQDDDAVHLMVRSAEQDIETQRQILAGLGVAFDEDATDG